MTKEKTSKIEQKTFVLLDSHAILHRAFHALPNFTSPKGDPTGALYGFSTFLLKMIKELNPDYIIACFDLPGPTFRHIAYEDYKAKRPKIDDTLISQINRSRDILDAFNIPIHDSPGFEADDILGTIVKQIKKTKTPNFKIKTFVASGDMDTMQLIENDDVVVYTLGKGIKETVIYNEDKVKERFGFEPKLLPDFKGLMGDPSDNIIGVQGVGQKTATQLIVSFGTIENLYKAINKNEGLLEKAGIKSRIINILKESEEDALFSKTLAQIRDDAPIKFSLEKSEWKRNIDLEKIKIIFNELGFRSLLDRLSVPNEYGEKQEIKQEDTSDKEKLYERFGGQVPRKFFDEVEWPLFGVLDEMQKKGIKLDTDHLEKLSKKHNAELKKLEKKIWLLAGEEFNVSSPKQLGEIIFTKLGLKVLRMKKTKSGSYSTNMTELVKLKDQHPIIEEIINYREISKLVSTYIDALPKLVDKENRLHTTFDQAGTATGRLSSKDPNIQNIPKKTELGMDIRKAFVVEEGFDLVAFDYSQVELRVTAILSGDQKLKEIFKNNEDVHSAVSSEVFNVPLSEVTSEMRRRAKVINFGIIYGMGVNSLSKNLGCSKEDAQKYHDEYFNDFKGVAQYLDQTLKNAYKKGYTETLFGRKRFFPELLSGVNWGIERMVVNAPIQGTSADLIKMAMVEVDKALEDKGLKKKTRMLLQIHDELVFEIEKDATKEAVPIIKDIMEGVYKNEIPLSVNIEIGKNWGEMVSYA